jgi:hypothetical protein
MLYVSDDGTQQLVARERGRNMDQKFQWMRELLGRLEQSNDQWQTAAGATKSFLGRAIERDLSEFRRLCRTVRQEALAGTVS